MRPLPFARISMGLILAGITLSPAIPPATHAAGGQTVTMYSYEWTPSSGTPTAAHPLVYHALQVLADKFKSTTGITVKFIPPVCQSIVQSCLTQTQTYYQAQVAANTAPDIVVIPNSAMATSAGYFLNLQPYMNKPDPYNTTVKSWCYNFAFSDLVKPGDTCHSPTTDPKLNSLDVPLGESYPGLLIGEMANTNLLKQAGVKPEIPTDWSAWLTQLAALKAKGLNAMSGETSHTGAQASSWPFWSALWPAYMGHVLTKVAPKATPGGTSTKDSATAAQTAAAIKSGIINANDPMYQAMFQQVKKYMSYWVNGWQTADVEALWTQGKLAERQFYIADLFTEYSNPDRHFNMIVGFPPYPTKKTDPRVMQPYGSIPKNLEARLARGSSGNDNSFGIIASSVKRDNNEAAAIKWLQYISAPAQDQYITNEHPDYIPTAVGSTMAPIYAALNNTPIPDWRNLGSTYFGGLSNDATPNLEKELAIWVTGHENDKTFFAHMEQIMTDAANSFIAAAKK
ncbi:MAG: ABC transporter substrate-binding protein [Chloroflexota bacterium]